MNEKWKAFIWGIIVGATISTIYILWDITTPTYPHPLSDEETQVLQTTIDSYNKQVAQP